MKVILKLFITTLILILIFLFLTNPSKRDFKEFLESEIIKMEKDVNNPFNYGKCDSRRSASPQKIQKYIGICKNFYLENKSL